MNLLEYFIKFDSNGKAVFDGLNTAIGKTEKGIASAAFKYNQITEAITGVSDALNMVTNPAIKLESSMAELSSITGVTGNALKTIETNARAMAREFGGDAAATASAYTDVLSRLGPEIAQSPEALNNMGRSIATLSKTMKGDTAGAMDVLTTSMLQYNVSLQDPMKASEQMALIMNMIAQSAKLGSAQVPQIAQSLKVVGNTAYTAGVSMSETNAAIQVLGKSGLYGAEAGTKFRNVLLKLGEGRFLPKATLDALKAANVDVEKLSNTSLSLADRMSALNGVAADGALITQIFGAENQAAAQALLQNEGTLRQWTAAMTGTNEANIQAAMIMNTTAERIARMKSLFADWMITIGGNVAPFMPFISGMSEMLNIGARLAPLRYVFTGLWSGIGMLGKGMKLAASLAFDFGKKMLLTGARAAVAGASFLYTAITGIGSYITSLITATAAQYGLNLAMLANPIGVFIAGLAAVGVAVYAVIRHWDVLKKWVVDLGSFLLKYSPFSILISGAEKLFPGFLAKVSGWFTTIKGWAMSLFGWIGDVAKKIGSALGFTAPKEMPGMGVITGDILGSSMGASATNTTATTPEKTKATSDAIVSGGQKSNNVTINLRALVETINNHVGSMQEAGRNIEDEVLSALSRVLATAQGQIN